MEEKILKAIEENKEESVRFLRKLISFDSSISRQGVNGKEGKAAEWLAEELKKVSCEIDMFYPDNQKLSKYPEFNPGHDYTERPNVVGSLKGKGGGRSLILNGHIDTVPPGDIDSWKHNPWEGGIEGDKVYGRGSVDMKGGVAAMIMAVKFIKAAGIKLKGDVILQCVVDEEGGGNGTLACVDKGYKADAAIITEPTSLKILVTHRGAMHLKVRVKGKSTHVCFRWKGVSAIEKMVKIMNSLSELEKRWLATKYHPLLPSPTIMAGEIKGGVGASIVPGECAIKVDVKYLPQENKEDVQREVEENIKNTAQSDPWLKEHPPEILWTLNASPYEISSRHPLAKTLGNCVNKIKEVSEVSGLPSGADARILNNIGKIPTVIFGPGDLSQAHSIDESISISEYIKAIKILTLSIIEWSGKC
jgi:acetylornithine deacetylase